jgi:CDP-diacylglycerol--glycerol-3-phosphate 3-phosphatidyltransferase
MKKQIANILTFSRIIIGLSFLLCINRPWLFVSLFAIGFLTDAVDGTIARYTKSESKFGEQLDDIADTVMIVMMILVMIIWLKADSLMFVPYIVVLIIIRIANGVISKKKYGKAYVVHTYPDKMSGLVALSTPIIYLLTKEYWIIHVAAITLILVSLEITIIYLTTPVYDPKRKWLFESKKSIENRLSKMAEKEAEVETQPAVE